MEVHSWESRGIRKEEWLEGVVVRSDLGGGYPYTVMLTGIYIETPQSTI